MTIHFNPFYDAGVWTGDPAKGVSKTGEVYEGPLGLLSELELQLALGRPEVNSANSLHDWYESLEAANKQAKRFYDDSFATDSMATSVRLLHWRDALVLAGWTPEIQLPEGLSCGAKEILTDLACVETEFQKHNPWNIADRWREVIITIPKYGVTNLDIVLNIFEEDLDPFWRNLLDLLSANGAKVHYPESAKAITENISLLHFKDYTDACMWAALNDGDDVIMTSSPASLDMALECIGKPAAGSSASASNHIISHLFLDVMKLCIPGININNCISYLTPYPHPLDGFKNKDGEKTLRGSLLRNLVSQNGIGISHISKKDFQSIIAEYSPEQDLKYDPACFVPKVISGSDVDCKDAMKLCSNLSIWASEQIKKQNVIQIINHLSEDPVSEQLHQIISYCDTFKAAMTSFGFKGGRLPVDKYKQILAFVYNPSTVQLRASSVGSKPVAPSVYSLAGYAGSVVWLDCVDKVNPYQYAFLSDNDLTILGTVDGICIPSKQDELKQADASWKASLANADRLILAYCNRIDTTAPSMHQLLLSTASKKAKACGKKVKDYLEAVPFTEIEPAKARVDTFITARTQQLSYSVGKNTLKALLPAHYSPSSIDLLLERPFDFVMKYCLGLWEESNPNIETLQGTVAHLVINKIATEALNGRSSCSAEDFKSVFKTRFKEYFEDSVKDSGMTLLLPENSIKLKHFRYRLMNHSIPDLIKVIEERNLQIVGTEVACAGNVSCSGYSDINLAGSIDMLLKNEEGHYVVFDFKWHGATATKKRDDSIKKGTAYQPVLYAALVEQGGANGITPGPVDAIAYFMLASSELFYDESVFHGSLKDLFEKFNDAIDALIDGEIREGEGMDGSSFKDNSYGENKILKGKLN